MSSLEKLATSVFEIIIVWKNKHLNSGTKLYFVTAVSVVLLRVLL